MIIIKQVQSAGILALLVLKRYTLFFKRNNMLPLFQYIEKEIHRPCLPSISYLKMHNLYYSYIYVYAVVLGDIPVNSPLGEGIDSLFSGMFTIAGNHVWGLLYYCSS